MEGDLAHDAVAMLEARLARRGLLSRLRIHCVLLATLTLLFGLQIFRVYLPTVMWYLGQFLSAEGLALYGLATFALALLAPVVRRAVGARGILVVTVGGLALARLAIQLGRTPSADLVFATAGLVLFSWFIPHWCQSRRNCLSRSEVPVLAIAFPLAFLIDTGTRSLMLSYDLAWRSDLVATLAVLGLVVVVIVLLWHELTTCAISKLPGQCAEEPALSSVLPLLALGPWLFIAMTVTHNPAALAAATGWRYGPAHVAVNGFAALGAVAAVWVAGLPILQRWNWALIGGGMLVGALAFLTSGIGPGWLWLGLASVNSWAALGEVLTSTARTGSLRPGLWRTGLVTFLALTVLLIVVILLAGYNMFGITPIAGVVLGLSALWATRSEARRDNAVLKDRTGLVGAAALIAVLAVALWAVVNRSPLRNETPMIDRPLRVMTYNIHHGLDVDFSMDLQAIIDVIKAENPDVVVLNEVNRARITNGYVDTLLLISHRLGMPYVFGANIGDRQYGNALLSRYPILAWDNTHYAHKTTEVRGLLRAVVQAGGEPVTFFATHLDHLEGQGNVRAGQVAEALEKWAGESRAILLGDLNAEPDAPELQGIYEVGFQDALAVTGQEDVFTFWDPTPSRRLDFIFLTPDLSLGRAWVVASRASDHLPVLAEVGP
jgi:endonuclease/exonuclease/phosphatase family metal-dependent hydrolase